MREFVLIPSIFNMGVQTNQWELLVQDNVISQWSKLFSQSSYKQSLCNNAKEYKCKTVTFARHCVVKLWTPLTPLTIRNGELGGHNSNLLLYIDRGKIWRKVSKFLGLWKFLNTYFCPSYWLLLEWYNGKCTDSYIVLFYTPGIFKALYTTLRIQPYTSIHTSTVIYAFSASWKHR